MTRQPKTPRNIGLVVRQGTPAPTMKLQPESPSIGEVTEHLDKGCTFGIPPDRCGKAPVCCEASSWPFLLFCSEHGKIAKGAFGTLLKLQNGKVLP